MASIQKLAITRWVKNGERVPAGTPGAKKVKDRTECYYIVDKSVKPVRRINTDCTNKEAAEVVLTEYRRARERGEVGLTDPHKEHKDRRILEHLSDYLTVLRTTTRSTDHHKEVDRVLTLVFTATKMETLRDLTADKVQQHLAGMTTAAATINKHRTYIVGFCNYLVGAGRLPINPITKCSVKRAKAKDETERRKRRAMKPSELRRLVAAVEAYPVKVASINTGGRPRKDGTRPTPRPVVLKAETKAVLEQRGRERRLLYRLAILTGLRRGELSRLKVKHLCLTRHAKIKLPAPLTKSNRQAVIPLVPSLAADLAKWIKETGKGANDPVVYVPSRSNMAHLHEAHLKLAGIEYKDQHDRYADFHAIRKSINTFLRRHDVPLRERQLFLRHRAGDLSTTTYDDDHMTDMGNVVKLLARLKV